MKYKHEYDYYSAHDSKKGTTRLFYNLYTPLSKTIEGTVLIIHGMKEHSGRYAALSQFLAEQGFLVLGYDHIGHGHSVEHEFDLGFIRKDAPEELLVEHSIQMLKVLQEKRPNVPHFVLGHSMGSFITRLLLKEESHNLTGAIIVGTGDRNISADASKPLFRLLNRLKPTDKNKIINETFDKMNNARFKDEPEASSTSWLSLDPTNREAFAKDPLCGVPFSNNGFYGLIMLNTLATQRKWADSLPRNFPLLFVSGEADPIGDFGNGVKKIVETLHEDNFDDVTLHLYPQMRHEILNESIKERVYNEIMSWIRHRIDPTA